MKWELLIQNNEGIIKECSSIAESVEYTTNRTGSPGKLTLSLIKAGDLSFREGNTVRFSIDGVLVFYGYVFSKSKDRWGVIEVTAYDQLRYLKTNESYCFVGATAGQIIQTIANQFNLTTGMIEDTGYAIPSFVQEDKGCLDIISHAIDLTTANTGKVYVFFDDGGKLSLRLAENLTTNIFIGTKSLMTEYTYKTDIDSDTYNQIKLVRPNKETGKGDVVIYKDSETIDKWGLLQKYEKVDEQLNEAQMAEQAQFMLKYYNRVSRTLSVEALGAPELIGLRAGAMVMINVPDLGDISLSKFVLLDKVTHTYENELHTISLETKTVYAP